MFSFMAIQHIRVHGALMYWGPFAPFAVEGGPVHGPGRAGSSVG